MVLFGASQPLNNHAQCAVNAARDTLMMLAQFNQDQSASGKSEINIGIGIAKGKVVAGYTGPTDRATYTSVGDKVNFAARLNTHTKSANCPILIDRETRTQLMDDTGVAPIGPLKSKGFAAPSEVFSVAL